MAGVVAQRLFRRHHAGYATPMTIRTRKFIGTFATLFWLVFYALVVMALGGEYVVGRGMLTELVFYVIAGVAWVPVAMVIIKWMARPDPS
jgi:hypothetical protein